MTEPVPIEPPEPQEPAEPPLRLALRPRRQRTIAALTAACLLFSGLDAFDSGNRWSGAVCLAAAALGAFAVARSRHVGPFLRWSNGVSAVLLAGVAALKFEHGKVVLPVLQMVAVAMLLALAIFDLPRPGALLVDERGLVVRRSRLRSRTIAWGAVREVRAADTRLLVGLLDGTDVEIEAAAPIDEATLRRIAARWPKK